MRAPIGVSRYETGEFVIADATPSELEPAIEDLPALAEELTERVAAAADADEDSGSL